MDKYLLDLPMEDGRKFHFRSEPLKGIYDELEEFLECTEGMDDLHFAKKMLFSHELKANNQVEGYSDDLELIEDIIKKKTDNIQDENKRARILNLYRGYQFILRNKVMDDKHLKKLYGILSEGLLCERNLEQMGKKYREASVSLLKSGRIVSNPEVGVDYLEIDNLIAKYFEFINNFSLGDTKTLEYIKSQIMHFYFVYIHPYFDVNGRTSRTMSLWYLLKKKDYPYIIFNRGITFAGANYDNIIRGTKYYGDMTLFLKLMLETVKVELEKEKVMQEYATATHYKFSGIDYQTILYLLTMGQEFSLINFALMYNKYNDKRSAVLIYKEMLEPLIDAGILQVTRYTKKRIGDVNNMEFVLNKDIIPSEEEMHLKRIKL
ncbi:MAG TPA: Fic family protein [Candidatus Onthocola stercorigallinarum]|nr:Fic family protein [Candidatus Onthocola stercorigallinarum]